jgi:hypothetical protein
LRGSANSFGLIVQYVPDEPPYQLAPSHSGSNGSNSAPSYEVDVGLRRSRRGRGPDEVLPVAPADDPADPPALALPVPPVPVRVPLVDDRVPVPDDRDVRPRSGSGSAVRRERGGALVRRAVPRRRRAGPSVSDS